ncbi:hypothetical protein FXF51_06245 [Nonomuraea sp. PA05]|uniref:hypothetical protein n=1 Tax=Nonomuraea sp. PA05 TaxID=2604466 RepID=UPI0011D9B708|nr:hypothetical protein [Nonomuraea sp. PA05]TYB69761.1 hypothetical protein FXF51_06245 [Nonomuraea sp. PA05]
MTVDPRVEHDHLVTDLRGAVHNGESGLAYVPRLLKRLLETEAWRERYDVKSRTVVMFKSFMEFVTTPATEGLGASIELIDRIVGTDDPDLLILLREAKAGTPGRPRADAENPLESNGFSIQGESTEYTAARLAAEAPEEFEAVQRGEKSIHAAAVAAGFRRRRIPVRLDNASSALRSLQANSSPEFWAEFKRLVAESE